MKRSAISLLAVIALGLVGCPDYEAETQHRKINAESNLFETLAPATALGKVYKASHCTGENSDGPGDPYVTCVAIKIDDNSIVAFECPYRSQNTANCIPKVQKLKVTEREVH